MSSAGVNNFKSKFGQARLLIFVLVFVSHDFKLGNKRQLRRVDHQSRMGLIYFVLKTPGYLVFHFR